MAPQSPLEALRWQRTPSVGDSAMELLPSPSSSKHEGDVFGDMKSPEASYSAPQRSETAFSSSTFTPSTINLEDSLKQHYPKSALSKSRTPVAPQRLRRWTAARCVLLVWDMLLCFVPVSFLVLAILVSSLEGQEISTFGQHIQEWSLLGPTIFPIFFAGIVGRTMKFVAQYKLEKGANLETLEKLVGSQSVFGALFTQMVLKQFGLLSIGILLIWAFSPLGGQSALRILGTDFEDVSNVTTLAFLNMTNQPTAFTAAHTQSLSRYAIDAIYAACLISPASSKTGPQDTWGNVKIPSLEAIDSAADANGWKTVPENATYSSLLGIPVAGIPMDANSTFIIPSYYYNMGCQSLDVINTPEGYDWLTPLDIPGIGPGVPINYTNIFDHLGPFTFYMDSYTNMTEDRVTGKDQSPMNVMLLSRTGFDSSVGVTNVTLANCTVTTSWVQSEVYCSEDNKCGVVKIRRDEEVTALAAIPGDTYQKYSTLTTASGPWAYFYSDFQSAITLSNDYGSTPPEWYMSGEELFPFQKGVQIAPLYNQTKEEFARRFGQLFNTYWLASLAPESSSGNLAYVTVRDLLAGNTTLVGSFFTLKMNATEATISRLVEVYSCNNGWLTGLILASSLMLLLGVGGTILKYLSYGPDVLGYVSTAVADSIHGGSVDAGSHMDGLEKTRYLRGLRVRLEDVRDGEQVGKIAIAPIQGNGVRERSLKTTRLYA